MEGHGRLLLPCRAPGGGRRRVQRGGACGGLSGVLPHRQLPGEGREPPAVRQECFGRSLGRMPCRWSIEFEGHENAGRRSLPQVRLAEPGGCHDQPPFGRTLHPRKRARLGHLAQPARADTGSGGRCLHARRDAAGARLPGVPQVRALARPLRHALGQPTPGVSTVPGVDSDDLELLAPPHQEVLRPLVDSWAGRLPRHPADCQRRLSGRDRQGTQLASVR
mmetsp:Transcript_6215/g.15254  ORF Transcript_6215/g.15254 Transcript_6215/m.15254 type:complete len:221 (+) Transcript_6215:656-1318(+)